MKTRIFSALVSLILLSCTNLQAASLYWDSNSTTTGAGSTPTGTWGTDSYWNTVSSGSGGTLSTALGSTNTGIFSAGSDAVNAYTITVSGSQQAGGLTFEEGTPTITGGTIVMSAGATIAANSTLAGTATIESAIKVNTDAGGTITFVLTANDGAGATDLLLRGSISATTAANAYQLRLGGAGNGRIEGAISNHGSSLAYSNTSSGTWTIAGNQSLGSTKLDLTQAGNKLVMGDSTSDVQSWGASNATTATSLLTIKSNATSSAVTVRGGGGIVDVVGSLSGGALTFGVNGTNDSSQYGVFKLSSGTASFTSLTVYGTGHKVIGGAESNGTLIMNITSGTANFGSAVTLGGADTNENNLNLIVRGAGKTSLGGPNTFTGSTTVNGSGGLILADQNAIQNSTLTMTGTGSVIFSSTVAGNAFTIGGLAASAAASGYNIGLQNNAATPVPIALTAGGNNQSTTYAGVLSGSGSLIKAGTGTLNLTGANTYTGTTTVSGGLIQLNVAESAGTSGPLGKPTTLANSIVLNGGGLQFSSNNAYDYTISGRLQLADSGTGTIDTNGGTVTFANAIGVGASQTGALTKTGSGTLVLSGSNSYTGATTITGGTLQIGSGGTGGSLSGSSAITNHGALVFNRSNPVVQGTDFSAAAISGSGSFTQAGAGSLTLMGNNTYTGATNVTGGTLIVSGSLSGSTSVNVSSSGTLQLGNAALLATGGTATFNGKLALNGASSTGQLNLNAGSTLSTTISGTAAGQFGQVSATGGITLVTTGSGVTLSIATTNYTPSFNLADGLAGSDKFVLALGNGTAVSGTFSNVSAMFDTNYNTTLNRYTDLSGNTWAVFYNTVGANYLSAGTGSDIALYAIPEPNTWAMLLGSLGLLRLFQRSRRVENKL